MTSQDKFVLVFREELLYGQLPLFHIVDQPRLCRLLLSLCWESEPISRYYIRALHAAVTDLMSDHANIGQHMTDLIAVSAGGRQADRGY